MPSSLAPQPHRIDRQKGDAASRRVTRELTKGFLHAFDVVPHEYINILLQIFWPDANLRRAQRELQAETQMLLRAEVASEKEKTNQE